MIHDSWLIRWFTIIYFFKKILLFYEGVFESLSDVKQTKNIKPSGSILLSYISSPYVVSQCVYDHSTTICIVFFYIKIFLVWVFNDSQTTVSINEETCLQDFLEIPKCSLQKFKKILKKWFVIVTRKVMYIYI